MSIPPPAEVRRIALGSLVLSAFILPARHLDQVVRIAGIPLAAMIGLGLATAAAESNGNRPMAWTLFAGYLLATVWLAVTTHRMVLLDAPGSPTRFDGPALRRLALFALTAAALWALFHFARIVTISASLALLGSRYVPAGETPPTPAVDPQLLIDIVDYVASAAMYLVVGRLALLLPAAALDRGARVSGVWRMTRGNAWRLAVVVGALPWALNWFLSLVELDTPMEWALMHVVVTLTVLIEVVAVSLAYRELTTGFTDSSAAPAPPPTGPRA